MTTLITHILLTNLWVQVQKKTIMGREIFLGANVKIYGCRELAYKCDVSEGFIFRNHLLL